MRLLAVDPSSGGTGGLGWALFEDGELVSSGAFLAEARNKVHYRLQELWSQLRQFEGTIDLLAVECLPRRVHHYVMWSVGMTIVAVNPKALVEVPIKTWKEVAREQGDNYQKGDEADALCIGLAALRLAGGAPRQTRKRTAAARKGTAVTSRIRKSADARANRVGRVPRKRSRRNRGRGGRE